MQVVEQAWTSTSDGHLTDEITVSEVSLGASLPYAGATQPACPTRA